MKNINSNQKAWSKEANKATLYGHQKRKENRTQKHRKNTGIAICDEEIISLYDEILSEMLSSFDASSINNALMQRYRFFKKVSNERVAENLSPLILPVIAYEPKRPSNTNRLDTFLYLPIAQKIVENATRTWQTQNDFAMLDMMAWLLFSLMVYGGYSDDKLLRAFYESICHQETLYQLPNGYAVMCVDIDSPSYGRRVKDKTICYSRWVVLDDVGLLWLGYINRFIKDCRDENIGMDYPSFDNVISRLGDFIDEKNQ